MTLEIAKMRSYKYFKVDKLLFKSIVKRSILCKKCYVRKTSVFHFLKERLSNDRRKKEHFSIYLLNVCFSSLVKNLKI